MTIQYGLSIALVSLSLAAPLFAQSAPSPEPRALDVQSVDKNAPTNAEKTTIAELQERALQNNPALKYAESLVEAERGARTQASARPNPKLRFTAEEVGAQGKAGKQGARFEQEFGGGARRQALVQASDRALDALNWSRLVAVAKIENDVSLAARRCAIAAKKVEFRRQLANASKESQERAQTAFDAGSIEIRRFDLIRLQNLARQADLALKQELEAKIALDKTLALLVGEQEDSVWTIEDDVEALGDGEELDEKETIEGIVENSPALKKARAEVEQKRAALIYERTPKREFDVEGGASYDYADSTTLASVGIGVPLRVNDRNEGNIRRASGEYVAAQRALEREELRLRTEAVAVFAVYKSAREDVRAYREQIVPELASLYETSRQAYDQGQIDFLELADARSSYVEASLERLDALERLSESLVKLQGAMLTGSLDDR